MCFYAVTWKQSFTRAPLTRGSLWTYASSHDETASRCVFQVVSQNSPMAVSSSTLGIRTCLITYPLLVFFPFLIHSPTPGVTSPTNHPPKVSSRGPPLPQQCRGCLAEPLCVLRRNNCQNTLAHVYRVY